LAVALVLFGKERSTNSRERRRVGAKEKQQVRHGHLLRHIEGAEGKCRKRMTLKSRNNVRKTIGGDWKKMLGGVLPFEGPLQMVPEKRQNRREQVLEFYEKMGGGSFETYPRGTAANREKENLQSLMGYDLKKHDSRKGRKRGFGIQIGERGWVVLGR